MPVQKFRSIEEMNKAPLPESRGSDFQRFLRHCARWWAIAPKQYPRGVFKFRTIEDAQKAREKHLPLKDDPRLECCAVVLFRCRFLMTEDHWRSCD